MQPAADDRLSLGAFGRASGRLSPNTVIADPAATPPVTAVSLSMLLVSLTVSVFMEQGR